jgi:hypothetical protein
MLNGVSYSEGSVNGAAGTACQDRFFSPGSAWKFVDVCADTCFCDNLANPVRTATQISYVNNHKSFVIDKVSGVATLSIDTNREWRNGCALNQPVNGTPPQHAVANAHWNWSHLLVEQDGLNVRLDTDAKLEFRGDFRLGASARTMVESCPESDVTGDDHRFDPAHALAYVSLLIEHVQTIEDEDEEDRENELKADESPVAYYALVRLWGTEDGQNWRTDDLQPHSGGDPIGDYVYIARNDDVLGNYKLQPGMTGYQSYRLDVRRLAREALRGRAQMFGKAVNERHYRITAINFGVEVWGGFRLDLAAKNLSLTGYTPSSYKCAHWQRYWNQSITDHLYAQETCTSSTWSCFVPSPFGWNSEGTLARSASWQVGSSVPLYRYWNQAVGDHFYTTGLWPFGAGCSGSPVCGPGPWVYEGVSAYVWTTPDPGRRPIYEFWNANTADHLYSASPTDGNGTVPFAGGYTCSAPGCNVPAFYMLR